VAANTFREIRNNTGSAILSQRPDRRTPRPLPERGPEGLSPGEGRVGPLLAALAGGRLDEVARALHNDLEAAAVSLRPEIRPALQALREAGCLAAITSGSGPSVFGLAEDEAGLETLTARAGELLSRTAPGTFEFVAVISGPGPGHLRRATT